jgi:protein-tyrosine sulfotransferase
MEGRKVERANRVGPGRFRPSGREGLAGTTLVLLVGAARSGTTLLRLILDAHPEIGCPAEAGIPALAGHLAQVWWTIASGHEAASPTLPGARAREEERSVADVEGPRGRSEYFSLLPVAAQDAVRAAIRAPMEQYCGQADKPLYCDKSLDSVYHLPLINAVFPQTRSVLLFRHVMDVVASGIEASPWGFQAFGFTPFIQASSDNFVAALVSYWLSHVGRALSWEEDNPELCHRLRYEDLVTRPDETLTRVFEFFGVTPDLSTQGRAFDVARATVGPGDYKVAYTSSVHTQSIGRGKRVPVSMIPPPMLDAVNEKLLALGYEALGPSWNVRPLAGTNGSGEADGWSNRLLQLMQDAASRSSAPEATDLPSFALVAEDHEELRWVIEPGEGRMCQGDGEVDGVVTGTAQDLVLLITNEVNPGVLLRSGRIRHVTARDDVATSEIVQAMTGALDYLRTGLTTPPNGSRAEAPLG